MVCVIPQNRAQLFDQLDQHDLTVRTGLVEHQFQPRPLRLHADADTCRRRRKVALSMQVSGKTRFCGSQSE